MTSTVNSIGLAEVRRLCSEHDELNRDALTALAPIAADGHRAHLVLYIAAHAADWRAGRGKPPGFVTFSKHTKDLDWDLAEQAADDPVQRAELHLLRKAGDYATAHLVQLAEPLIGLVTRQLTRPMANRTTVVDLGDLRNVGRAAVAQGIWAYDPDRSSGPHYLRQWIEEHIRRELAPAQYQVSLPTRAYLKFQRISAIRSTLAEQHGQEPADTELLAHPDANFTQCDLDNERATRPRRCRTGLGLNLHTGDGVPAISEAAPLATHDRTDPEPDDPETQVLNTLAESPTTSVVGWRAAAQILQLGAQQSEILAQRFGLPPHDSLNDAGRSEQSIATRMDLEQATIHVVLLEIQHQLAAPGGRLHHVLNQLPADAVEELDLVNFKQALGDFPTDARPPGPMPRVLTMSLPIDLPVPRAEDQHDKQVLVVRYLCWHCGWTGRETAWQRRFVLPQLLCPDCSRIADVE
ncbi:hypothetical protein [Crossiella cryophila]|uniref:Uncharacterized protein n=1 Tax=Crossiella cryophila TaxID=43355 RepID=A0A7W7CIN8_9PSEU|nr:hypothetical protein [Crossiella cryophila]MBB4681840.1 hypothetical protein [Crossiella cryophila]